MGRQMDDLLRKRIYDVVSKPRSAGVAVGEWLDPEVRLPYEPAHRSPNVGCALMNRSMMLSHCWVGDPRIRGRSFARQGT